VHERFGITLEWEIRRIGVPIPGAGPISTGGPVAQGEPVAAAGSG
jgi:hypothetical protein